MTATAAVRLAVNGQPLADGVERLLSVRVAARLGQPTQCELSFLDSEGGWPVGWAIGSSLEVAVDGDDDVLFDGEVTAVGLLRGNPDPGFRIRAYDRLHRLRRRQTTRVLTDVTVAEVITALVAGTGLGLGATVGSDRLERVVQHRQSDWELLVEVVSAIGQYPVVRGRTLELLSLGGAGGPVPLTVGASLWEATVEANLDRVVGRATVLGWHPQQATLITGQATTLWPAAARDRAGRLVADGLQAHVTLTDQGIRTESAATALAEAVLHRSTGRAVAFRGIASGSARLWPGVRVAVGGLASDVDGEYVVTGATHTIDGSGFITAVTTDPPEAPAPRTASSVTLGVITAVVDPEQLGRVRVSLPALGDVDAGWLAILAPGAGRGRGLVVLPDVGDWVVVALPGQSPVGGVVLGSLFGTVRPPDSGVGSTGVQRWTLTTADGQSIVVDDAEHRVRVGNRAGSFVELGPDVLRLHAASDLVIDAPGHALTIRAASVDFEQAVGGEAVGEL